ncbi:MAG: hypothetical protein WCI88_10985 [Chloroflexota bacterium]
MVRVCVGDGSVAANVFYCMTVGVIPVSFCMSIVDSTITAVFPDKESRIFDSYLDKRKV